MPTPRATQARDELGLKARLHGTPPDDVGLDAGSSLREGTGLWGWLWGPQRPELQLRLELQLRQLQLELHLACLGLGEAEGGSIAVSPCAAGLCSLFNRRLQCQNGAFAPENTKRKIITGSDVNLTANF